MISAEKGYGVEDLKQWLAGELPESPWYYPEDQPVSYTHLRAHETVLDLVCRLLLEKKKTTLKPILNVILSLL